MIASFPHYHVELSNCFQMTTAEVAEYRVIGTYKNELRTLHIRDLKEGAATYQIGANVTFEVQTGWSMGRILFIGGIIQFQCRNFIILRVDTHTLCSTLFSHTIVHSFFNR
jgi:hypothetical protein